jgi:serine phosphatase RsbU (regulator of sigma subunit)/anti-sigma regulatory factor (Ser/Thr protein kinase)/transposase
MAREKKKPEDPKDPGMADLDAKIAKAQARLAAMQASESPTAGEQEAAQSAEGKPSDAPVPDDMDARIAKAQARLAAMQASESPTAGEQETAQSAEGKPSDAPVPDDMDAKIAKAQARLAAMQASETGSGNSVDGQSAPDAATDSRLEEARIKLETLKSSGADRPAGGDDLAQVDSRTERVDRTGAGFIRESLLPAGSVRRLRVLAEKEQLADVRSFVSRFGPLMGLSSRQTNRLRMCVDEAFTNIFRHAYAGDQTDGQDQRKAKRWAIIEMRSTREYVDIRCIDWGKEFFIDKGKITAPDLQKYVEIEKKGGLGLFMINKFTSYWELTRVKDRNILLMRFVPELRPEPFLNILRRNLSWNRMTLRFRFTVLLLTVFTAVLSVFYFLSVSAQRRSLNAYYEAGAITGMAEMSMNSAQFLREDPDLLGLAVLLQEAKNSDPAILSAGIIRSNQVIMHIASDGLSAMPEAYAPPVTPGETRPARIVRLWRAWAVPILEKAERRNPRISPFVSRLAFRETDVRTNRGFSIYDYRDAGILHIKGRWKWGGEVFLTLSKDDYRSALKAFQNRAIFIVMLVGFFVVIVIAIYWLGATFLNPVRDFLDEMRRLSQEGLKARLDLKSNSNVLEIKEIQGLVNTLIEQASTSLAETKTQLAQAEIKAKESEEIVTDHTRMKSELLIGQEIQRSLLPDKLPDIEGYEIGAAYVAATEMGGDYYDFIQISPTGLGMVVGDVSGHGISSAMMMSGARLMLNALRKMQVPLYSESYKEAHKVLGFLNDLLEGEFPKGMYITMYYVFLDAKKREVNYASAGHNPMILYRGDTRQVYNLNPKGFAIGLDIGDASIFRKALKKETLQLRKGDLLLIYTDGITEAMNAEREEYGERRLIDAVKRFHSLPAPSIAENLIADVREFTGGVEQSDDITFIVLKEQSSVSEIVFNRRIAMLDAVEKDGMSETEAAKKAGVSTEEFRRMRRRRKKHGPEALREEIEDSVPRPIDRMDIESSAKLLHLIATHPEYSVQQLQLGLDTNLYGFLKIEQLPILRELKRLNLANQEKRQRFARREKQLADRGKKKSVFIRSAAFLTQTAVPYVVPGEQAGSGQPAQQNANPVPYPEQEGDTIESEEKTEGTGISGSGDDGTGPDETGDSTQEDKGDGQDEK